MLRVQVMYDRSGAAVQLRKYMGLSLAWWHSYKWATKKIMQVFGKDIIAPMFHHLFPDREYAPDKMKLPAMTTYLSYIRLAYPSFRDELAISLSRRDLTARQSHVLQNLSDLCEFFIPAVREFLDVLFLIVCEVHCHQPYMNAVLVVFYCCRKILTRVLIAQNVVVVLWFGVCFC